MVCWIVFCKDFSHLDYYKYNFSYCVSHVIECFSFWWDWYGFVIFVIRFYFDELVIHSTERRTFRSLSFENLLWKINWKENASTLSYWLCIQIMRKCLARIWAFFFRILYWFDHLLFDWDPAFPDEMACQTINCIHFWEDWIYLVILMHR